VCVEYAKLFVDYAERTENDSEANNITHRPTLTVSTNYTTHIPQQCSDREANTALKYFNS